jgi:hypothetical protein
LRCSGLGHDSPPLKGPRNWAPIVSRQLAKSRRSESVINLMHEKLLLGVPARARALWLRQNHCGEHQQLLQILRSHRLSNALIFRSNGVGSCETLRCVCWGQSRRGHGTVCPVAVK